MAAGRVMPRLTAGERPEWAARLFLLILLLALPLAIAAARPGRDDIITLHASMPESGGWQPGHLSARVGEPLHLRLTSDDVVHGFAIGAGPDGQKHDSPEVDVKPGEVAELTLTFDRPGTYTYTCTRWCGPNHWRMRGTIQVSGGQPETAEGGPPLYVELGLDIDAPHPPAVVPQRAPDPAAAGNFAGVQPQTLLGPDTYLTQSPAEVWLALRDLPELSHLDDSALWDAVAYVWHQNTNEEALALGEALYSENCAACHGESGAGDGVFAGSGSGDIGAMRGHEVEPATNFTGPALLGASNALLQGKIIRGGMGTGMPAWGTIFTGEELQALLDYLWTFQFAEKPLPKGDK